MSTMPRLPIEIETGPEPTAAIIIMHGLGADGSDFVPVAQELDLGAVGNVRYVFPVSYTHLTLPTKRIV